VANQLETVFSDVPRYFSSIPQVSFRQNLTSEERRFAVKQKRFNVSYLAL
jgi:hypothetical protein